MLGLVELTEADGVQLREIVRDHSKADGVLARTTSILLEDDSLISVESLILLNINHWPEHALQGKPRTVETWQELIVQPATWTDVAFVQLVADVFKVSFHHIGVDDLSTVFDMGTISPCDGVASVAMCEIGVWYDRHFVAILDVSPSAQGNKPNPLGPPDLRGLTTPNDFSFPLTEVSEVRRFVASFERVSLVAFEFSGAMRSALEATFDPQIREAALSVDLRPCDIGGPHFQGDVRDVIQLATWHRAFFFPPCFQQLRGDLDCIESKIKDKRAYWGCLQVLYCIFSVSALMVYVEQPDTIFGDCFDPNEWPSVELYEFRTSHYDDPTDKFVRLTTRNVRLRPPTHPFAQPAPVPRSQFDYRDADERDRKRSSWALHVKTCQALATAQPIADVPPPPVSVAAAFESFAVKYHLIYGNVPSGYLSLDGRPPDAASRAYQTVRGKGDGRLVASVQPLTLSSGLVRIRPNGTIASYGPPSRDLYSSDDETDADDAYLQPQQGAPRPSAAVGPYGRGGASDPTDDSVLSCGGGVAPPLRLSLRLRASW